MRRGLLLVLLGLVGIALAGTCPTCSSLNYDCVPAGYTFDNCPIAPSSCPIADCGAHCEGLLGAGAVGTCSSTLFTCLCEAAQPGGNPPPPQPPAAGTPSAVATGGQVQSNTVTVAALETPLYLYGDGTMNSGVGFIVGSILVAVACAAAIASVTMYVYPRWVKGTDGSFKAASWNPGQHVY